MTIEELFNFNIIWFNQPLDIYAFKNFKESLFIFLEANDLNPEIVETLEKRFGGFDDDLRNADGLDYIFYFRFFPHPTNIGGVNCYIGPLSDRDHAEEIYNEYLKKEGYTPLEEDAFFHNYDETTKLFDSLNESKTETYLEFLKRAHKGEKVKVINGPFNGFIGNIVDFDEYKDRDIVSLKTDYGVLVHFPGYAELIRGHGGEGQEECESNECWWISYKSLKLFNYKETTDMFNQLYEQEGFRYTIDDLKFMYENNIKLYEISPVTGQPFRHDDFHKNEGIEELNGNVVYHLLGFKDEYRVCWNLKKGGYKCSITSTDEVLDVFNRGRFTPVDFWDGDSEILFDQLNESEEDDLAWAEDIVNQPLIPKWIKVYNKLDFIIPSNPAYNYWQLTSGTNGWVKVDSIINMRGPNGEIIPCYSYYDANGHYLDMRSPVSSFDNTNISFEERKPKS